MSVSDGDGEGVATGIGDSAGSAIVAYQATRRDKKFFCFRCEGVINVTLLFFLFFSKRRVPKSSKNKL